jgi:hypothetical protein
VCGGAGAISGLGAVFAQWQSKASARQRLTTLGFASS